MITREELVPIGYFKKPHGIKGEITFLFTNDSFTESECPFLFCELDDIYVPFRIENYRFISDSTAYIQLKNLDSDQKVRLLSHKEVFYPIKNTKEETKTDSFTWDYFIGFTIYDERFGKIGLIVDVDETTINTLFVVEKGNDEILIPAVEEFIIRVDESREELWMVLPEGLIE